MVKMRDFCPLSIPFSIKVCYHELFHDKKLMVFLFEERILEEKKMKKITALLLSLVLLASLAACGGKPQTPETPDAPGEAVASGVEDGILTVAMECAYAPYNWTQPDDSNGAVPIKDSSEFANGYDVMMAKQLCEAIGWELEIVRLDWDSLIPAVQTGMVDAVIAGQSMTPDRMKQVDFAGPYLYATIVCLTMEGSPYAGAKGISDLAGGSATSQMGTIWYDTCLPQIEGAKILTAQENAPTMLMALATGTVDFVCTDMPTAQGALIAYPDMVLLDFEGSDDNFKVEESDINIGISIRKGNTVLLDALNVVLGEMTADDFNDLMAEAIKVQPMSVE